MSSIFQVVRLPLRSDIAPNPAASHPNPNPNHAPNVQSCGSVPDATFADVSQPHRTTVAAKGNSSTIGDFLRRHAPALSIQERKGLESTVHGAVSAYLREMRQRAELERQKQRKMIMDTAEIQGTALIPPQPPQLPQPPQPPPPPAPCQRPRENTASSLIWRSQTPYTASDRELKAFRHAQNPRKPPPQESPPLCPTTVRPATVLGITSPYTSAWAEPRPPVESPPATRRPHTARAGRIKEPPKASVSLTHRPKTATGQLSARRYHVPKVAFKMNEPDSVVREEYVPCLKAWIDGASDYERSVVTNVMKVLQKGKRDGMEGLASRAEMVPAPYSAYRTPTRYGRRTRPETPLEQFMASSSKTDSRQYFGGYDDNFRKSQKAQLANPKDYICEQSCFNNAMPTFRAHFDIHPDWVSESKANRTALTKTSQNGLRYGAKNC